MKKLHLLLLLVLPLLATSQINFEKGDWASVKAKAQKENKTIFIDFYTTWCGPCKVMDKNIFPLKNVGDFYNANFINYKIDAEKGEGIALAKNFSVKQYPTYVFADATGKFLHQAMGAMSAEEFIAHGKDALDPSKHLSKLLNKSEAIAKADMPAHLRSLSRKRLPYNDKYEAYISSLSNKELFSKETFELMNQLGGRTAEGFTFDLILKHKNDYYKTVGEKDVNNYFYRKLLSKAYTLQNKNESIQPVLDEVKTLGFDFAEKLEFDATLSSDMYKGKGYDEFVDKAKVFIEKYIPDNDPAEIYSTVFVEAIKFFHKSPKLKAYTLQIADQLIKADYRASIVNAYLGQKYVDANQLEKALSYYQKADQIAKANKEDGDFSEAIKYIKERMAVIEKGDYTFNGKGFDTYNGMTINVSFASPTTIGDYVDTEKVTIVDGKFTLTGNVKTPVTAGWIIYDGDEFKTKGSIVLEPGTFPMVMNEEGKALVENATYNYYTFNAWKTSNDYKEALKAFKEFTSTPDLDMKDPEIRKKFFEVNGAINKVINDHYTNTFDRNPDPLVKVLVAFEGLLFYDKGEDKSGSERLALLEKLLPGHYLVETMKYHVKRSKENEAMRNSVGVGNEVKTFASKDHDGNEVDLADVLKKNNYVLVEFWASWCGPCRGAIPHLKEAYNKYKKKGFEIVSFSIDKKREAWDKAFKEENIPWIDLSDLMGRNSPIARMYGVNGVPASYLVDKNGKIIDDEMRGDKLDETLKEIFGF